ncbi:non-LEE-encoded type III secreted effector domain protein [Escherichia coli]|nr:non-LEE-encoded type III secreted effector domain protein [Escherichia coli]
MSWTLTGICYERSQRKYIVTNPADYDKYSDMVKKYVIDGEELIIKYYMYVIRRNCVTGIEVSCDTF